MVRSYKRKTPKRADDTLERALRAILEGMSVRAAARDFGISARALTRHLNNNPQLPRPNQSGDPSVAAKVLWKII